MKKFLITILGLTFGYINGVLEEITDAVDSRDKPRAIKKIVTLLTVGLGVVGFFALILAVLYAGRKAILAVVAPIATVAVLFKSYQLNHPDTSAPTGPVQQPGTIELARARAEKVYPLLAQTAFLLLSELCHYLPGLVKPFSLRDVIPKVHYEITSSFVTIHHFLIAKGDSEADRPTMQEILETILDQHLQIHDLPISLPTNYISADGDIFPSLMIDGIYDAGKYFRVDLVITNEAQVSRLRGVADSSATSEAIIHDKDFD